jgi:hypothetical protein
MRLLLSMLAVLLTLPQGAAQATADQALKRDLAQESRIFKAWSAPRATGVLVTSVEPGSQAERLGLRPADILIQYGKLLAPTFESLRAKTAATPAARTVTICFVRNDAMQFGTARGGTLGITGVPVVQGPPNVEPEPTEWEPDYSLLDAGGDTWYAYEYMGYRGWEHEAWRREGEYYVFSYETKGEGFNARCEAKLARTKGLLLTSYTFWEEGKESCRITRQGDVYTVVSGGKTVRRAYPWGALPYFVSGWLRYSIPLQPGTVATCWLFDDQSGRSMGRYQIVVCPKRKVEIWGKQVEAIPFEQRRLGQLEWVAYHAEDGTCLSGEAGGFVVWRTTKDEALAWLARSEQ